MIKNKINKVYSIRQLTKTRIFATVIIVLIFAAIGYAGSLNQHNSKTDPGASASSLHPEDINNDNYVNGLDVTLLTTKWKTNDTNSDVNRDGTVDIKDLSYLISRWGAVAVTPTGYNLVWQDNFDSSAISDIDRTLWNVENFTESMKGERQVFVDLQGESLDNRTLFKQNGYLHLVAKYNNSFSTNPTDTHISSSVIAKNTQKYGRISGRIRLPMKRFGDFGKPEATFPAFWSLGKRLWIDKPWPSSGELDFMEHVDMGNWVRASVHNTARNGSNSIHGDYINEPAFLTNTWFMYGIDWTSDEIKFYAIKDPIQSANTSATNNSALWQTTPINVLRKSDKPSWMPLEDWWPFDDEIAIIINHSIGGGWVDYEYQTRTGALPNYATVCNDPASSGYQEKGCEMLVDWVRVETPANCPACTSGKLPF